MEDKDVSVKSVKINRVYPSDLHSHFINNVLIQHQQDHFVVSFFEVWAPAILGISENERIKELEAINMVDAKCVARLVFTPSKMKEFLKALEENVSNFDKNYLKATKK